MKKKSMIHHLIYGNSAAVVCVLFTAATMMDLILCVSQGIRDISYWHLGDRFILCILVSLSFHVFKLFDKLPLYAMLIIHAGICILIMLGAVWITSLYTAVHPNAYRDAVRTIIIIYPAFILGCIIIDGFRTAKANRILKKRFRGTNP